MCCRKEATTIFCTTASQTNISIACGETIEPRRHEVAKKIPGVFVCLCGNNSFTCLCRVVGLYFT